jgi:hypothetical protein
MSLFFRALPAAVLVAAAAPALAAPGDELCKRDLFMADAALTSSYRKMELGGTKPDEQCAAWRAHVEVLKKTGAAYAKCAVGPARAAKTAELGSSASDFQRLIGERCRGK